MASRLRKDGKKNERVSGGIPRAAAGPRICLCMIVKNEAAVIARCLASVRPLIDRWIIVDTGSTDGKQEIIGDFMRDIPGALHQRPWVDFALLIDAADALRIDPDFRLPALARDS